MPFSISRDAPFRFQIVWPSAPLFYSILQWHIKCMSSPRHAEGKNSSSDWRAVKRSVYSAYHRQHLLGKKKKKDSIHIPSPYHLYIFKRSVPAANYSVRDLLWRDIQKDVMKSKRKNLTYLKSNLSFHPIIESVKIYWDSQCTM